MSLILDSILNPQRTRAEVKSGELVLHIKLADAFDPFYDHPTVGLDLQHEMGVFVDALKDAEVMRLESIDIQRALNPLRAVFKRGVEVPSRVVIEDTVKHLVSLGLQMEKKP